MPRRSLAGSWVPMAGSDWTGSRGRWGRTTDPSGTASSATGRLLVPSSSPAGSHATTPNGAKTNGSYRKLDCTEQHRPPVLRAIPPPVKEPVPWAHLETTPETGGARLRRAALEFEVFGFKSGAGARLESGILKLGTPDRLVRTLAPPLVGGRVQMRPGSPATAMRHPCPCIMHRAVGPAPDPSKNAKMRRNPCKTTLSTRGTRPAIGYGVSRSTRPGTGRREEGMPGVREDPGKQGRSWGPGTEGRLTLSKAWNVELS